MRTSALALAWAATGCQLNVHLRLGTHPFEPSCLSAQGIPCPQAGQDDGLGRFVLLFSGAMPRIHMPDDLEARKIGVPSLHCIGERDPIKQASLVLVWKGFAVSSSGLTSSAQVCLPDIRLHCAGDCCDLLIWSSGSLRRDTGCAGILSPARDVSEPP